MKLWQWLLVAGIAMLPAAVGFILAVTIFPSFLGEGAALEFVMNVVPIIAMLMIIASPILLASGAAGYIIESRKGK